MPFIKRGASTPVTESKPGEATAPHIAALSSPDAEMRWGAARALGGVAAAVPVLAAALDGEQNPRVREAIMTALMRIGDEASVRTLLPYLRSQDARQRSAAIETLQALPGAVEPFVAALLGDADTDVRLLATELARNMPPKHATLVLCDLLKKESHPNVCAAAVEVLAEVGTRDALPTLKACAERFANVPFLPFAIEATIARISSTES
ncbi:HEAT repeat domain-containing protein [Rhodoplanes sp. Z2-YC6860]|uniref:HEAT repeat domain-containing protein n=1 Tax=Rhodoplanes sp. Z2-YC6860 TaxID=674703 RepID=UPI00078C33A8|nr:HEAT repeat domain-containing protein [Rhodoplanes sp. Z2-YC6860]AMN40457.1 HEAT repeat-containing PBS lyase [Rhodoplanes sp. Z2-YC6860]